MANNRTIKGRSLIGAQAGFLSFIIMDVIAINIDSPLGWLHVVLLTLFVMFYTLLFIIWRCRIKTSKKEDANVLDREYGASPGKKALLVILTVIPVALFVLLAAISYFPP